MSHRPLLTAAILGLSGWGTLTAVGACSLGEGVTATCNADDPRAADACQQVAVCDDGTGRVVPEEGCCIAEGTLTFLSCGCEEGQGTQCPTQADRDRVAQNDNFQAFCNQVGDAVQCCVTATNTYQSCLTRVPSSATTTGGGMGGAGGQGGGRGGANQGGANQGGSGGG